MSRRLRKRHIFAIVAILFGLFAYWWLDGGRYRFKPRRFGVVEAGAIYRSGQIHEALIEDVLREHGIRVIVDLAEDKPGGEHAAAERAAAKRLGIRKVDLKGLRGDAVGPIASYAEALEAIVRAREAGEPVLVHCEAGSQRTGAAVAWYRMLIQGWDGARAHEETTDYQRWHSKNEKLVPFVNANMQALAAMLVARGILERVPDPLPVYGPR